MNLLQSLGVCGMRLDMRWTDVAPDSVSLHRPAFDATDPNAYPAASWAKYDPLIRGLTARHIGIDLARDLDGCFGRWLRGPAHQSRWVVRAELARRSSL
jgi:hypothetical protein